MIKKYIPCILISLAVAILCQIWFWPIYFRLKRPFARGYNNTHFETTVCARENIPNKFYTVGPDDNGHFSVSFSTSEPCNWSGFVFQGQTAGITARNWAWLMNWAQIQRRNKIKPESAILPQRQESFPQPQSSEWPYMMPTPKKEKR